MKKRNILIIAVISLLVSVIGGIYFLILDQHWSQEISISVELKGSKEIILQYYYEEFPSQEYSEINSVHQTVPLTQTYETAKVTLPNIHKIVSLRMDFGSESNQILYIKNIQLINRNNIADITSSLIHGLQNDVIVEKGTDQSYKIITTGQDPWLSCIYEFQSIPSVRYELAGIIVGILFIISFFILIKLYPLGRSLWNIVRNIYFDKKIIWKLSQNDFKKKYAGASFGIVWAFIQPLVTIFVFWFVFQIGFRNPPVSNVPFSLWLTSGFIPWFFFQDAWTSATYALEEYNYLVKKIAFKMEYLPLIKILSSFFVHVAFIIFLIMFALLYGYEPTLYLLQLPYYVFCMLMLVVSLGFLTSAVNAFFKDMGQLIGILLQFGMWLTPIMWDYHSLPFELKILFKLNPMFYIVEGYRDCFIYHRTILEHIDTTIIFWTILIILTKISLNLFKNLKPHFADVL